MWGEGVQCWQAQLLLWAQGTQPSECLRRQPIPELWRQVPGLYSHR